MVSGPYHFLPCSSDRCCSSIGQNKHQAGELSPCLTMQPGQIHSALSLTFRPPHNISRLNNKTFSKHLTPSIATAIGHQDQEQKNLWSTQKPLTPEPTIHHADHDLAPPNEPRSNIICSMLLPSESLRSYSDQTGKFPINQAGEIFIFSYTNTSMQHPFLTDKLQPFAMHGNPPTKH